MDKNGVEQNYKYNIYSGQLNSPPGTGRSATASFSLGNNLEAKVRDFADTTGNASKKVKLIDQLNLRSGYNFLADSLKMSTISMSMSTSIFGKLSLSGSANFDPYAIDERGRKYNRFAILPPVIEGLPVRSRRRSTPPRTARSQLQMPTFFPIPDGSR